ncbi:MAG: hypothetical protein ACOCXT_01800 [Candidatus Dojkabacteria bacterium]
MDSSKVFIDTDNEITSILEKILEAKTERVTLVIPDRASLLTSITTLKILKRVVDKSDKLLVLVTLDDAGAQLAQEADLIVVSRIGEITEEIWDEAQRKKFDVIKKGTRQRYVPDMPALEQKDEASDHTSISHKTAVPLVDTKTTIDRKASSKKSVQTGKEQKKKEEVEEEAEAVQSSEEGNTLEGLSENESHTEENSEMQKLEVDAQKEESKSGKKGGGVVEVPQVRVQISLDELKEEEGESESPAKVDTGDEYRPQFLAHEEFTEVAREEDISEGEHTVSAKKNSRVAKSSREPVHQESELSSKEEHEITNSRVRKRASRTSGINDLSFKAGKDIRLKKK